MTRESRSVSAPLEVSIPPDILARAAMFKGDARKLEAALGAYVIGQLYGWRALYMVHTQAHCRKLEAILGARFSDLCPESTSITHRSLGIRIAEQIGSFWRVARGKGHNATRAVLNDDRSASRG